MKLSILRKTLFLIAMSSTIVLSACNSGGGGSASATTTPTVITIGGNVESGVATIANSKPVIYSSTTGNSWSKVTSPALPANGVFLGTTYANNQFIAVGGTRNTSNQLIPYFYTSSDGKTWTANKINGVSQNVIFMHVAYGNGTYVVVAVDGFKADSPNSYIYTSTDGQNWTQVANSASIPSSNSFVFDLKYLKNQFVVLGFNTSNKVDFIYTSQNGNSWSAANLNGNVFVSGSLGDSLAYGNNLFSVIGTFSESNALQTNIYTSTTGSSWSAPSINMSSYSYIAPTAITYANGEFAVIASAYSTSGGQQNLYIYSTNGVAWNIATSNLPSYIQINYIKYFNNQFIGTGMVNGSGSPVIYTSSNGTTLNSVTPSDLANTNIRLFGLATNK